MAMQPQRLGVYLASLLTASCTTLSLGTPEENKTYATPVRVVVSASGSFQPGSFRAVLDGSDITNVFNLSSDSATASLATTNGPHKLEVSANVYERQSQNYYARSASARFEAAPPGSLDLQLAASVIAIAPGTTEPLPVWIARYGAFSGQVSVRSELGNIVIYPNSYTEVLQLTASRDELPRETNTQVVASGALYSEYVSDSEPLKIRHAHKSGIFFSAAAVVAQHALDTATGPDGITNLIVQNGPAGGPRFEARFRRNNTTIGSPIGFDPGLPEFGGGGFCAGGDSGFVISGGSTATAHRISILRFEGGDVQEFSVAAANTANQTVVSPRLHFSPTCGIVVIVGANPDPATASTQAFMAEAFDLVRRTRICSVALNTAQVQPLLLAPASGNQVLRLTSQPTNCLVF